METVKLGLGLGAAGMAVPSTAIRSPIAFAAAPPQMEGFRSPNFPLVADILYWLVFR